LRPGQPTRDMQSPTASQPLDYANLSTTRRDESQRRAWLLLTLLLCWALAGYIVLRENILKFWWDRSFLDPTIQPMILSHGIDRWLMPVALLGRYAALLIFPHKLSPDYGGNVIGSVIRFDDPYFYLGIIAASAWLALSIRAAVRRDGAELFCLLALAITYALVGNIFTLIGTNFGERLMYLPSVFFVIFIAIMLIRMPPRAAVVTATILLSFASIRTFSYARRWNDRLIFYQTSLSEQPRSIRLYMLLASELMSQNRLKEASEVMDRARHEMPNYNELWIQSGVIALARDRFDEADTFLDHALQLKPNLKAAAWKQKVSQKRAATRP